MDLLQPIKFHFAALRAIGLWSPSTPSMAYRIYGILLNIVLSMVLMVVLLHAALQADGVDEKVRMVKFVMIEMTFFVKVVILSIKQSEIKKMIREMKLIDYQPVTASDEFILSQRNATWKKWMKVYFVIISLTITTRLLTFIEPILAAELPVHGWFYDLDWHHIKPLYIAIVLFYFIIVMSRFTVHSVFSSFILFYIFFVVNQKKIICARLSRLNGPLYRINFLKNIKLDQKLNQFVTDIQQNFSVGIFVYFSVTALLIGLLTFRIPSGDLADGAFLSMYLVFTLVQLVWPCYVGQELLNANDDIGTSIYNSNWLELESDQREEIVFGITYSVQPRTFIANHWFVLCLPTVTAVSNLVTF